MKEMQRQVDEWVSEHKIGYFKPLEIIARLSEETGELAREIDHCFDPKMKSGKGEQGFATFVGIVVAVVVLVGGAYTYSVFL